MRMPSRKYVIGALALAVVGGGVAHAAAEKLHTMQVAAPDGSTIHVAYAGDVAPRVRVVPAGAAADGFTMADPFVEMDRISAMMDAQVHAMMSQAAQLQRQAIVAASAPGGSATQLAPGITMVGAVPKGMHMTYTSTTTDARGCTRTVSYASDGSGAAPKVTQAASDACDAATPRETPIPARAPAPAESPVPANQRT